MTDIPNYYAILPASVRYHPDLQPGAKLLYGEITALASKYGDCWATNSYFSNLYGVDDRTIRRWVNSLVAAGFITASLEENSTRRITMTPDKNVLPTPDKIVTTPPDKNVRHNNTRENNTRIPTPKVPSPEPVSSSSTPVADGFESVWVAYEPVTPSWGERSKAPSKGSKAMARKAYSNLVKKSGYTADNILEATKRYVATCRADDRPTQNVSTFLGSKKGIGDKDYFLELLGSTIGNELPEPTNPTPLTQAQYSSEMTADEVIEVFNKAIPSWSASNPGYLSQVREITNVARDTTKANYHQKSLQMALELAKAIFRYKDSTHVRNSLVDPLFWLSHRGVMTEELLWAKKSGWLYLGYQLGRLAEKQ